MCVCRPCEAIKNKDEVVKELEGMDAVKGMVHEIELEPDNRACLHSSEVVFIQ